MEDTQVIEPQVEAAQETQPQAQEPIDSLLAKPEPAKAPEQAAIEPSLKVPEKYRVLGQDGKLDQQATMDKLADGYKNLVSKLGGERVSAPTEYKFERGEKYGEVNFDDALSNQFREGAHKAGLSQEQYQWVMEQYLDHVPQVLNTVLSMKADEARAELQKTWTTSKDFEAGIDNANRAMASAPESLRNDLWARFGRDPGFVLFAAHVGAQMREDSPPTQAQAQSLGNDAEALMRHPAYADPKHPEHAQISRRVVEIRRKQYGDSPLM